MAHDLQYWLDACLSRSPGETRTERLLVVDDALCYWNQRAVEVDPHTPQRGFARRSWFLTAQLLSSPNEASKLASATLDLKAYSEQVLEGIDQLGEDKSQFPIKKLRRKASKQEGSLPLICYISEYLLASRRLEPILLAPYTLAYIKMVRSQLRSLFATPKEDVIPF